MELYGLEMGLNGKVAIVTGATGEIGSHVALALANFGAKLALFCRESEDRATDLQGRILELGGTSVYSMFDISQPSYTSVAVKNVFTHFGRVDIVVNCAGVYRENTIANEDVFMAANLIGVNVLGPMNTMKSAFPYMKDKGWGRIVNIGSFAADVCYPGTGAYAASKAGLVALTKVAAKEVAKYNITANVVSPGTFRAGMVRSFDPDVVARLREATAMKRLGSIPELTSVVLFLCSPHSSYINGTVIHVDGGI